MKKNAVLKNNQKLLTPRQLCLLLLLCVFCGATVFIYAPNDPQHCWISYLVSGIGGILLLINHLIIYKKNGMQPLTTILNNCLGKYLGTFISILYAVFFLLNAALVFNNYSRYLRYNSYFDTPQIFIAAVCGLIVIYALYKGLRVIGRASEFFVWCIVAIFIISTVILVKYIDFKNIYPLKNINILKILSDSFYPLTLMFGVIVVFLVIFPDAGSYNEIKKPLFSGMIIVTAAIVMIILRTLLILGGNMINRHTYPIFFTYSVSYPIKFGVFASTITGLCALIKIMVLLYASIIIIKKIFKIKFNWLIIPAVLFSCISSSYLFKNIAEINSFTNDIWVYCAALFEIVIPIILLPVSLIKSAINRNKASLSSPDKNS